MNFSTVPSYRSMRRRASSKYRDNSSLTSSASRVSESAVNPTRSANSTDTSRRSAAGGSDVMVGATGPGPGEGSASEAPHSPQNFVPGVLGVPQAGQGRSSGLPHSPQNFRPGSFSVPQAEQVKRPPNWMPSGARVAGTGLPD